MHSAAEDLRIQSRRMKVAELVLRGTTNQIEICRQLGMEPSQRTTISRDIAALNREWRERIAIVVDEQKGRELARLDLVECAAWKGWDRSCLDAETREAIRRGDQEMVKKIIRGQTGDARFLDVILKCVQRRCELLGLDFPKEVRHEGEIEIRSIVAVLPPETRQS